MTSSFPPARHGHRAPATAVLLGILSLGGMVACAEDVVDQGEIAGPALRGIERMDNPAEDGWQTEVFADAAVTALKKMGKLLDGPTAVAADAVAEHLAPEFTCGVLRPERKTEVFRDAAVTVWRDLPPADAPRGQGSAGWSTALTALRAPFGTTTGVHAYFKIFRVTVGPDHIATTAYVEVSAPVEGGFVQLNATWQCRWGKDLTGAPPRLLSVDVTDYEEVVTQTPRRTLFTDCTQAVLGGNSSFRDQLTRGAQHWVGLIESAHGMSALASCGIAVADVNGDGLDDVYLCQPGGLPNRLFVQNPDGTATDRSADAGVDWMEYTQSALFLDLDRDGDQDLVAATAAGLVIMANDGAGHFEVKARHLPPHEDINSLAAADFDGDGDLDFYVCIDYFNPRNHRDLPALPFIYNDANDGGPNSLFRNDGDFQFKDVTAEVGLNQDNRRHSLAAAWEDYDNDGDPDLYVANDYGRNCLYRNDGGTFVNVAAAAGAEDCASGMSVSWSDYDLDGDMDLYVSNMWSSAGGRITFQPEWRKDSSGEVKSSYQRFARGNTLLRNRGDGTFEDVSEPANLTMGRWAWSSNFIDVNNDGWDDILVANGYLTGDDPKDL